MTTDLNRTWKDEYQRSASSSLAPARTTVLSNLDLDREKGLERTQRVARGLGWFSVALGAAQITAPRSVCKAIGIRDGAFTRAAMMAIGVRELAAGIGILASRKPTGWVGMRVAGDLMDMALLTSVLKDGKRQDATRLSGALTAVAGVTVMDFLTGRQLSRAPAADREARVVESITVNRSPEEVYRLWRNRGDLEITDDRLNEHLAWRSLEGADVPNAGDVTFVPAPGGRGTEIRLVLTYSPPAGKLGVGIAKLLGREPAQEVASDLRRFKQVAELGEVVHSDASIHKGPHPARPSGSSRRFSGKGEK